MLRKTKESLLKEICQNGNSNGRSRSVLSQINESVMPKNNFKTPTSTMQQFERNSNKMNSANCFWVRYTVVQWSNSVDYESM